MEAYTGSDILEFQGKLITDVADGDVVTITYPNELMGMKTGKNGNSVAVHNEMGREADVVIRVIKGSPDDKRLNGYVTAWKNRLSTFEPLAATFTKVITVDGGIANEITTLRFGVPTKPVDTRENVEGDVEQAIAVYSFRFADSDRALA